MEYLSIVSKNINRILNLQVFILFLCYSDFKFTHHSIIKFIFWQNLIINK